MASSLCSSIPISFKMRRFWRGYLGWGADLHMAQQMPLPLTISCSSKSRLVLPSWFLLFWYLLTRVVPDKFQKSSKTAVCVCEREKILAIQLSIRVILLIFHYICAKNGHISTSSLKSYVTTMFLHPDFLNHENFDNSCTFKADIVLIFAWIFRTSWPKRVVGAK